MMLTGEATDCQWLSMQEQRGLCTITAVLLMQVLGM